MPGNTSYVPDLREIDRRSDTCSKQLERRLNGKRTSNARQLTADVLRDMRIRGLQEELSRHQALLDMLLAVTDPEDIRAALELKKITPSQDEWARIIADSEPPADLRDIEEEKPW